MRRIVPSKIINRKTYYASVIQEHRLQRHHRQSRRRGGVKCRSTKSFAALHPSCHLQATFSRDRKWWSFFLNGITIQNDKQRSAGNSQHFYYFHFWSFLLQSTFHSTPPTLPPQIFHDPSSLVPTSTTPTAQVSYL